MKLTQMLPFGAFLMAAIPLWAQEPTTTNPIGMEFVLIKPGSMVVGKFQPTVGRPAVPNPNAPARPVNPNAPVRRTLPESAYTKAEELARKSDRPGFPITISKAYYIGKFEVTQEQWKKVMGTNPSYFQGDKVTGNADTHPIDNVTWQDAQAFIKKLNALDKAHTYRLPSEFEWEYAARAGAQDDIPWTDIRTSADLNGKTPGSVGGKKPNAWGLYDTLGNVWEWVQDAYNEKIFADPKPSKSGKEHVLKGASFLGDVKNATYMTHAGGPGNGYDIGFRLVMEAN